MRRELLLVSIFLGLVSIGSINAAWDLSNISYDNINFSVANQSSVSTGIFFKTDGTKMYITSQFPDPDRVYQYSLSTPWDVSTAFYDNANLVLNAGPSASGTLFFKSDGTALYVIDSFNGRVYQYSLSTPWNVSLSGPVNNTITFLLNDNPRGLAFKPDGTKMYTSGINGDSIYQYSLSTPWNVLTASYDNINFSVVNQDGLPVGLFFKDDGNKMFMVGAFNDKVYQYTLSSAWDISTAAYDGVNFDISTQETEPGDLFFNMPGDKMYIIGSLSSLVHQYSLGFVESPQNATFENVNVINNLSVGNNISASRGFFSFLGSSISRILKGWFTDIDVSGTSNLTGPTYIKNASCSVGQVLIPNSNGLVSCITATDVRSGTLSNIAYGDHIITFNPAFSSIPSISLTYCAVKTRIADILYAKNISTGEFTIQYTKIQGGQNENADVCWIATNAGNS